MAARHLAAPPLSRTKLTELMNTPFVSRLNHQCQRGAHFLLNGLALLTLLVSSQATAEPYRPPSPDIVLATIAPAELDARPAIADLHTRLEREPARHELRAELANLYIELHSTTGDPRYLGYAESVLADSGADNVVAIDLARADVAQARHDFSTAAALLDAVIGREPRSAQAWLMRAAVAETVGDYQTAATACARLLLLGEQFAGEVCAASVGSLQGRSANAYRILTRALADAPRPQAGWAHTIAAEISLRLGDTEAAAQHLERASGLSADLHPRIALADLRLASNLPAEALAILDPLPATDSVVLLRAIALRALHSPRAREAGELARARIDAQRGDPRHAREQALYALRIAEDPHAALAAAEVNFARQRERADALLLLEAALAADRPAAAAPVLAWMQRAGSDDVALGALSDKVQP